MTPTVVLTMLAARRLWVAQAERRYLLALADLLPDPKDAARQAGVSLRTLHRMYNRHGVPWRKGLPGTPGGPGRGNGHVRRWGPEVIEKAKKMRRAKVYVATIAKELGPSVSWVVRNTWDEIEVHYQGRGRPRKNERPCP